MQRFGSMPGTRDVHRFTGGRELGEVVFDEAVIAARVRRLGEEIAAHYRSGELLVLGLLKGSFIFLSDLVRAIERPCRIDFVGAASYGAGQASTGQVRLWYDPETPLEGRHVLLVEDIVESGRTLNHVVRLMRDRRPLSLEVCALLHKRVAAAALEIEPRFVGFDAPRRFLVGYGLDHAEEFRHLPFVATLAVT
jgi:hypoxanthine phosphoribosyltransferase